MRSESVADVDLVGAVHAAFTAFGGFVPDVGPNGNETIRWIGALLDGGHEERAVAELCSLIRRWSELPDEIGALAMRVRAAGRRRVLALALLGSDAVTEAYGMRWSTPHRGVAETVIRLADGDRDLEDATLRKVLEFAPAPYRETPYRVGTVVAALADAHRDEPAYLDHLAGLLDSHDRRYLAFAAPYLGPLGLDETRRLCGTVVDEAGEALVAAFADAGRFDDALALAVTLGADTQQLALIRVATPDLTAAQAKALLAAYRKCPKMSRQRDDQVLHRCRTISLLLALDRVDDALTGLASLPDCRYAGQGPAPLVLQVLRRFADRPGEVTPARLRVLLDVLAGEPVIAQELRAVVIEAIRLVHRLADARIRAELATTDVPRMRDRLRIWGEYADVGLVWARVDDGELTAADPLFTSAAGARTAMAPVLLALVPEARLADRNPELFSRLLAAAFGHVVRFPVERFGPDELRLVPGVIAATPNTTPVWVGVTVARFAADTGDRELLAGMVAAAPDLTAARYVAYEVAVFLARAGDLTGAAELAEFCGFSSTGR